MVEEATVQWAFEALSGKMGGGAGGFYACILLTSHFNLDDVLVDL